MILAPPPANLAGAPRIFTLPVGYTMVRFHDPSRGDWATHRFYGPLPGMRFDHHTPPCGVHPIRSVWYAARSLRGAVAETFGRLGILDRASGLRVCMVRVQGSIEVLDLVGVAARAIGLTQEIAATSDHDVCQAWARACYDQWSTLSGIRWRARQIGSLCVVLNDRASMNRLIARDFDLDDPRIWPRLARAARDCHLSIV